MLINNPLLVFTSEGTIGLPSFCLSIRLSVGPLKSGSKDKQGFLCCMKIVVTMVMEIVKMLQKHTDHEIQ